MPVITGTEGPDGWGSLTEADTVVNGLGGNDYIRILGANSAAHGDGGDDTLLAQPSAGATTLLDGGDGNDSLLLDTGSATLTGTLNGGAGDDVIESRGGGHVIVDAGVGNDDLILAVSRYVGFGSIRHTTFDVTLGGGADSIVVSLPSTFEGLALLNDIMVVNDFQTGAGGDQLSVAALFNTEARYFTNWDGGNPFASGHLRLIQSGADTVLQIDADGAGAGAYIDSIRLRNVDMATVTAFNLAGLAPDGSTAGETLTGTAAADTITGTNGDDLIQGLDGDDYLRGAPGNDRLEGGGGSDILDGGHGQDQLYGGDGDDDLDDEFGGDMLFGEGGNDRLEARGVGSVLDGGDGNDELTLVNGTGTLIGGAGDDLLVGTGTSNATVITGSGSDTIRNSSGQTMTVTDFTVGAGGDRVQVAPLAASPGYLEAVQRGADTIIQGVTLQNVVAGFLTAFNTNGYWITAIHGEGTNDTLIGNQVDNTLRGFAGDDFMDGRGGADLMIGGAGNDVYVVETAGDRAVESAGEGFDIVYTEINYQAAQGEEIELISARDWSATTALQLTGNAISNILYGNAGANVLDGGAGIDSLLGQGGNDVYVVDNAGDNVYELAGEGRDTVYASVDYALSETTDVEILSARDWSTTTPLTLQGNGLANEVYGNAGANLLDGRGGADVLVGFGGNDTYIVDNAGDYVLESAGEGRDVVFTSTTYALTAGSEVEILSTRDQSGTTAIDLYGNAFANELAGNAGSNRLDGGAGADVLSGFGGADLFTFTTALGGGNVDWITDFAHGSDRIGLDAGVFAGLTAVTAGNFVLGATALDADDRILFDATTGALYFDADGSGAQAAVRFATLSGGSGLSWDDFVILPAAAVAEGPKTASDEPPVLPAEDGFFTDIHLDPRFVNSGLYDLDGLDDGPGLSHHKPDWLF